MRAVSSRGGLLRCICCRANGLRASTGSQDGVCGTYSVGEGGVSSGVGVGPGTVTALRWRFGSQEWNGVLGWALLSSRKEQASSNGNGWAEGQRLECRRSDRPPPPPSYLPP